MIFKARKKSKKRSFWNIQVNQLNNRVGFHLISLTSLLPFKYVFGLLNILKYSSPIPSNKDNIDDRDKHSWHSCHRDFIWNAYKKWSKKKFALRSFYEFLNIGLAKQIGDLRRNFKSYKAARYFEIRIEIKLWCNPWFERMKSSCTREKFFMHKCDRLDSFLF